MKLNSAAALAILAGSSEAFVIRLRGPLASTRLDPILSPGKPSGHQHTFFGGNALAPSVDLTKLYEQCSCTTAEAIPDCSLYWAPQLYAKNADNNYTALPVADARAYYFDRSAPGEKITIPPAGFRFIIGNANANTLPVGDDNDHGLLSYVIDTGTGNPIPATPYFPTGTAPKHLEIGLIGATCWDGVNLDSADHISHTAYRAHGDPCPSTHPYSIPQIKLEVGFNMKGFDGSQLVLATGDRKGFSYHFDYVFGWQPGFLEKVMADPTCGDLQNAYGQDQQCEALLGHVQGNPIACHYTGNITQEESGWDHPISKLPGCNLEFGEGQAKPTCSVTPPTPNIGPGNAVFNMNNDDGFDNPVPIYDGFNPAPTPTAVSTTVVSTTTKATPTSTTLITSTRAATTTLVTSIKTTSTTTKPSTTSTTPASSPTPATGHNLFGCVNKNWAQPCVQVSFSWDTCFSFKNNPVSGVSLYHNMRSAGTDDTVKCTLYNSDTCASGVEKVVLPVGGTGDMGSQSAHWGSFKCSQR